MIFVIVIATDVKTQTTHFLQACVKPQSVCGLHTFFYYFCESECARKYYFSLSIEHFVLH